MPAMSSTSAKSAERYDVVVVGAGFAGLYMLHRLRGHGLSARVFEAGRRRRRHLVLEPLSGRALRRRERRLLVLVLRGARAGVGWSERYAAQPEILRYLNHVADRFDLRRDIRFETRVTAPRVRRGDAAGRERRRRRAACSAQFVVIGDRLPVGARRCPTSPASTRSRASGYHTGDVAARGRRLHRQAGRRGRHRLVRHPGHPGHRAARRAPDRLPAHGQLQHPEPQRAAARGEARRPEGALRRSTGTTRASRSSGSRSTGTGKSALETPPEERASECRGALAGGRRMPFVSSLHRLLVDQAANETIAEFVRAKIREMVSDPATADLLRPTDIRSAPSGSPRTRATSRRSTATTSRSSTSGPRRSRRSRPAGSASARRRRVRARRDRVRDRLRRDHRGAHPHRPARPRRRVAPRQVGRTARARTSA